MRSLRTRLLALLATLVALLAAAAPVRAHYFCHMREHVVPECCCPKEPTHAHGNRPASVRASDCCERIAAVTRAVVATAHDAAASVPPPAIAAILPAYECVAQAPEATSAKLALARAPPAIGPPVFISLCRLLI